MPELKGERREDDREGKQRHPRGPRGVPCTLTKANVLLFVYGVVSDPRTHHDTDRLCRGIRIDERSAAGEPALTTAARWQGHEASQGQAAIGRRELRRPRETACRPSPAADISGFEIPGSIDRGDGRECSLRAHVGDVLSRVRWQRDDAQLRGGTRPLRYQARRPAVTRSRLRLPPHDQRPRLGCVIPAQNDAPSRRNDWTLRQSHRSLQ